MNGASTAHRTIGLALVSALATAVGLSVPVVAQRTEPQKPVGNGPALLLATIRTSAVKSGNGPVAALPGGRLSAQGATARDLVRRAYGAPGWSSARVVGGPSWVGSHRFDVEAKGTTDFDVSRSEGGMPGGATDLLRAVLRERFRATIRLDTTAHPVYALVRTSSTALGPKLVPARGDCVSRFAAGTGSEPRCPMSAVAGFLSMKSSTMEDLATMLGFFPAIDRVVLDDTALKGQYDLEMSFVPAYVNDRSGAVVTNDKRDPNRGVFAALRDQLGLMLQERTARIELATIVAIERPAED